RQPLQGLVDGRSRAKIQEVGGCPHSGRLSPDSGLDLGLQIECLTARHLSEIYIIIRTNRGDDRGRHTAKLPSKHFDSEGFGEQIVAKLQNLSHNNRQNPPNQRVSAVTLQWSSRLAPSRPRKAASSSR